MAGNVKRGLTSVRASLSRGIRGGDDDAMPRRFKGFSLTPWDVADTQTPLIRPLDDCLALEENYWDGSSDRDQATYRRFRELAGDVHFHTEPQDTECDAWLRMVEIVEEAAEDGRTVFWPSRELDPEDWARIVELPPSIARLRSVKALRLYGSHLVRIPREIGEMSSLEDLDVYTSHRLHWFPYEITRCRALRDSRVSTRSLYGNFKYRPPFPPLGKVDPPGRDPRGRCSVCDLPLPDADIHLAWISLRIATDVLPLLVRACSQACVDQLPAPAKGYVQHPHTGGLSLEQPPTYW